MGIPFLLYMKKLYTILFLVPIALMAQPRTDVNIKTGGFTIYDSGGIPYMRLYGATMPVTGTISGNVNVTNTVTIQGNVGLTNATETNINVATVGGVAISSGNITDTRITNFPLTCTSVQFTVSSVGAAVTNGAALAPIQTFTVGPDTESPLLLSATYICNADVASSNPQIIGHVFRNTSPTALGANGALALTYADITNYAGALSFTNRWLDIGTNISQTIQQTLVLAGTNYIIFVPENVAYNNNAGTPKDTFIGHIQRTK